MDFILTSTMLSVGKLTIALGAMCGIGALLERVLGFDLEANINALEKTAAEGNPLPLAIVLAAVVVTIGGILERFI